MFEMSWITGALPVAGAVLLWVLQNRGWVKSPATPAPGSPTSEVDAVLADVKAILSNPIIGAIALPIIKATVAKIKSVILPAEDVTVPALPAPVAVPPKP